MIKRTLTKTISTSFVLFFLALILLLTAVVIQPKTRVQGEKGVIAKETDFILQENDLDEDEPIEEVIDENTWSSTNRYFDLTLERKPQSPFGKNVPYILTVTPHLDSPRTQILWNTPTSLVANPKHREFVDLERGQTYTFEGSIKPLKAGTYDFSISVISWQHDTNYTNTIKDNVTFNETLVLQPVSSQYQTLNTIRYILIALAFIMLVVLTIFIGRSYMQKAKKWLTPPSW